MSKKQKAVLYGLAVFIGGVIIAKLLFNVFALMSVIGSFLAGAFVSIVMIARARGEKPEDVAREVVQQVVNPDPHTLKHLVEEQLFKLNQRLRSKSTDAMVVASAEKVIDMLLEVVPRAISESPNSEASFDLEKICTDYLPGLLDKYLELSAEDRSFRKGDLLEQLFRLVEIAKAAKASLDEGSLDNFQIASDFMKSKTV